MPADAPSNAPTQGPATGREVPSALAWGLVSKVLVSVLAIASNVIIVRGLGDEAYGNYSIFLNIARFLVLAIGLGQAQSMLQFLPEMRVRGDVRGARELLWRGLGLQTAAWVVVLGAIYLGRGWISRIYAVDLGTILLLGTALLLCEVLWNQASHVLMAVRRMPHLTAASVVQKAALIAFLLLLLRTGLSVAEVLWAVAASFLLSVLMVVGELRRAVPDAREGARGGLPAARLLRYAVPVVLGALTNQILWRSSEVLVVGHYWGARDAGFVNLAYNLPQLILEFVPLAIWPIILASLSEVHTRRTEDLLRGIRLYSRLLLLLVVPLAMTGFVLGGQAYLVLYGAPMAPGAPLCQAFFLIFLFSFLVTPLRMALFVKERAMANTWITLSGAVVNVALDFVFIPRYGIWGAVPPVAIALVVSDVAQYWLSRRLIPGLSIPWTYLLRVLAGSSIVLPLWLVREHLAAPLPVAGALAAATAVQFLLLRALRTVGPEEQDLILRSNLPFRQAIVRLIAPR